MASLPSMHLLIDLLLKNLNILEPKDFNFIPFKPGSLNYTSDSKIITKSSTRNGAFKKQKQKQKKGFYKGFSRNGEKLIKHNINFESLPPKKEWKINDTDPLLP